MRLYLWLKYVLWTAVISKFVGVNAFSRLWHSIINDEGYIVAVLITFVLMLLLGLVFGSIAYGVSYLIVNKRNAVSRRDLVEIFVLVFLLASIGNLAGIIIFGVYKIVRNLFFERKKV